MTDKTTPDERNRRPDPSSASPAPGHRGDDGAAGAPESVVATSTDGVDHDEAHVPSSKRAAGPLITAVEIENFKGIGRRMRVELRPITLLFGNNSAGKSTVLHALCYAHEILSHRSADAHKTDLGGDQVDLGGFRNLVHARDLKRPVRLRFELNLRDRQLPDLDTLSAPARLPSWAFADPLRDSDGWVELTARWVEERKEPLLVEYKVEIDGRLVGLISATAPAEVSLLANPSHPLIEYQAHDEPATTSSDSTHARERSDPYGEPCVPIRMNLHSAVPPLGQHLSFASEGARDDDTICLHWQLSILLVGIANLLRDALAQFRYLGPLRALHQHRETGRKQSSERDWREVRKDVGLLADNVYGERPDLGRWADGSAAWDVLNDAAARNSPEVVQAAGNWLMHAERLDTGYGLKVRSRAELPVGKQLAEAIQSSNRESSESPGESEGDGAPEVACSLVGAIPGARLHREVLLVNNTTGMPVRPLDVGVGISQLVPVVVAAVDPDRPGITAIEQPELHLHPRIQVELGDLFAQQVDNGGIFLIETHSEHLLLRFMKRMRQTYDGTLGNGNPRMRPEDIAVYFVEIDPDGTETLIREIPLNERGELVKAWPGGFFEEDLHEIF